MAEMDIYRDLGRAIAKRREVIGLTQAQVAGRIGLTRASLANIETGRQKVLLHHVYRLAEALKVKSISELIPVMVPKGGAEEALPLGTADITPVQKSQVEATIHNALASGRSTGRR